MITIEPPQSIAPHGLSTITRPVIARFLARAQKAVGLTGEVHVLLADDATLKRLNKTFRGKNKATDVLSFPAGPSTVFFGEPDAPELAGDLAISIETAARQAGRFGHSQRSGTRTRSGDQDMFVETGAISAPRMHYDDHARAESSAAPADVRLRDRPGTVTGAAGSG